MKDETDSEEQIQWSMEANGCLRVYNCRKRRQVITEWNEINNSIFKLK